MVKIGLKKTLIYAFCFCFSFLILFWGRNIWFMIGQIELSTNMQFVTNFTRIRFQNNFFTRKTKRLNYDKLRFPTKQHKLYFHIINIHTQGYITLNKYILCIASRGLPKLSLWVTKCVT